MKLAFAAESTIMNPIVTEPVESRPFFKRIGSFLPTLVILSLSVSLLIYLGVMQAIGWRTPVLGINGALSYMSSPGSNVTLYASPNTKTYFTGIGGKYDVLLTPWRNYFAEQGLGFKEIEDIAKLRDIKQGVLILPSAVALSEQERTELLTFRSKGGAILATWATGTRNEKGDWEGWQFLEKLGAKMLGEFPVDSDVNHLILSGESPVSHTQPAGERILMSKTSEALLRLKGDAVGGQFMNWARIPDESRRGEGAVIYGETAANNGRTAVFGFAESAWESHPLATRQLIDDTIGWLRRDPVIVRAAWPNGKRAAQIIEMDTEQEFPNALSFASMMQSLDYPATFYVLTSVGKLFPDVLTKLAQDFEIGFHGDIHVSFKDQPANVQEQRMQTMLAEMKSVIPDLKGITGFRAPTEGYDAVTEQLLHKFGIRHHTADPNRSEARLPVLAKLEGVAKEDTLVVLPRTQRDDINLYWEKLTTEQTTKALINDFDLTVDTGALGVLSIHTQNFNADGTLIKAMPGFLVHTKQRRKQVWIAPAGDVATWWQERDRFKLSYQNTGKRLEFNITVTGTKPLHGASLVVMLPQKGILPIVQSIKIGGLKPTVSNIDNYRAAIVFDTLEPGNYVYQVTFAQ